MKKNKFWIIVSVLFVAFVGLYVVFVSSEREKLSREEQSKKRSIKDLEAIRDRAKSGHLASDGARAVIDKGVIEITKRTQEIDAYLKDIQKDFLYVKGDKDWKYIPDSTMQYERWYNTKRDSIVSALQQNGFIFEKENQSETTPVDMDRIKEKMGFKILGGETRPEKDYLEAQQQLALFALITDALCSVFKDKKNVFPVFQKLSFDSWMIVDPVNSGVKISKVNLKLEIPYAFVNLVINELDKSKIQVKVEQMEILKKLNSKDYAEYPNVIVSLNLKFQIINDKKVVQ